MLNSNPIFVNSFARGGSNIVWEILQSHPDAAAPMGETDKIIYEEAGAFKKLMSLYLSARGGYPFPKPEKAEGYWLLNFGLFSSANYRERRLNKFSQDYLDRLFCRWKLKNIDDPYNKYKTPGEVYTEEEIKKTRVTAKHVNGMVFLTPALIKMYPESIHFGLVRNGLALAESRLRRGTFKSAGKFGMTYNKIVEKFYEYDSKYDNFHLLKFEDLLSDPKQFIRSIYSKAGLPYDNEIFIRLKAKKFVSETGNHTSKFNEGSKHWLNADDFFDFVNPNINENQIKRMTAKDQEEFLKVARKSMERLGYV